MTCPRTCRCRELIHVKPRRLTTAHNPTFTKHYRSCRQPFLLLFTHDRYGPVYRSPSGGSHDPVQGWSLISRKLRYRAVALVEQSHALHCRAETGQSTGPGPPPAVCTLFVHLQQHLPCVRVLVTYQFSCRGKRAFGDRREWGVVGAW